MRVVSIVRTGFYGLVSFAALTASVAFGFSLAITGPPTEEEMLDLGRAARAGLERMGVAAERLTTRFCQDSDLCDTRQPETATAMATAAEIPASSSIEAPPVLQARAIEVGPPDALERAIDAALLGGEDLRVPQAHTVQRAAQRVRSTRAEQAPILVERRSAIEQLAARVEALLEQTPAAYEAELAPDQTKQVEPFDDEGWLWEAPPEEAEYERQTF